ncbi:hypothetical protein H4R26_001332 [Coemansia thaxteri]|uniref:glucan 1,4-alpha-glucosidase n=1 Tax=Coemansia thaxteri TaxID=2663907 RepID=A0A9W8BN59_9FUNG|nr:hypothetical protein H4R26_001332 [Coemansia thaxteri]KAJ2486048.1 hypothetical protein EV174_001362 [Coemansia sp. RSA 2320]
MKLPVILFATFIGFVAVLSPCRASRQQPFAPKPNIPATPLSHWIGEQTQYSRQRILDNIAPLATDPSALPGAVCASPSHAYPDYYYAWTRDSALVMGEIVSWLNEEKLGGENYYNRLYNVLNHYVSFTRRVQAQSSRYGLGEAKFHMDGTPFTKPWCNAQTDGPAIRAITLIRFYNHLTHRNLSNDLLLEAIQLDLDYVARVWSQNWNCDIWEEARGLHFYTAMAQHRALQEGARLARQLGKVQLAEKYQNAADGIETQLLPRFKPSNSSYVYATLDWFGGLASKKSNLDVQVLLASLHFTAPNTLYSVESGSVIATVLAMLQQFDSKYAINQVAETVIYGSAVPIGVAIGRYPEDVYDGTGSSYGNPWSLATSALAEYHYKLALAYSNAGNITVSTDLAALLSSTSRSSDFSLTVGVALSRKDAQFNGLLSLLLAAGDLYMARVARHTAGNHAMTEQWSALDGYGRGAPHLTWSYAAHTAAARARAKLVLVLSK